VGNAGNISAHWMGYKEYQQEGKSVKKPAMVGYQAEGSAPFKKGGMVDNPETIATAIRIGHPQSWDLAHEVEKESNGWFVFHHRVNINHCIFALCNRSIRVF
jgi:threonine synthase